MSESFIQLFRKKSDKSPEICIVMPYFGCWPEWMELFLESCRLNPFIDWLFITDCGDPVGCSLPANVRIQPTTLEDFLRKVEKKIGINIAWTDPYKICDLRPAFGDIFKSEIHKYRYFGWGDIDVIYGNMRPFLNQEVMQNDCISFSKNHLSGHLCLWRNRKAVRKWYRALPNWRERLENLEYTHFDEPSPEVIPDEFSVFAEYSFNTPLSPKTPWTDGTFDYPDEWYWQSGRLSNDKDEEREFLYLHFMHWKGGWWPRHCGNAQWEKLDKLVHVEPGRANEGFRINECGFFPLAP
jgi:hypothetical protein